MKRGHVETARRAVSTPVKRKLNYPLVQLRRVDNEQVRWLRPDPASPFTNVAFTSVPVIDFPQGPALVTVFVNDIPSQSKAIYVRGYRVYLPLVLRA